MAEGNNQRSFKTFIAVSCAQSRKSLHEGRPHSNINIRFTFTFHFQGQAWLQVAHVLWAKPAVWVYWQQGRGCYGWKAMVRSVVNPPPRADCCHSARSEDEVASFGHAASFHLKWLHAAGSGPNSSTWKEGCKNVALSHAILVMLSAARGVRHPAKVSHIKASLSLQRGWFPGELQ